MYWYFTEDPDKKATSLFRTQLLTQNSSNNSKGGTGGMNFPDEHRVNIVQKEPRVSYIVELQWLKRFWDHGKLFEPWVVWVSEG